MPNLPRRHIEARRTGRGLTVVVSIIVALAVALIVGSFLLAGFKKVAAALAASLIVGH